MLPDFFIIQIFLTRVYFLWDNFCNFLDFKNNSTRLIQNLNFFVYICAVTYINVFKNVRITIVNISTFKWGGKIVYSVIWIRWTILKLQENLCAILVRQYASFRNSMPVLQCDTFREKLRENGTLAVTLKTSPLHNQC